MSAAAPRVTSVVATGGRTEFLRRAVRYWQAQNSRPRELIVVDDTPGAPLHGELAGVAGVRYLAVAPALLGDKLNLGFSVAAGEIFHKWDDDDIYRPGFLAAGVDATSSSSTGLCVWDCYLIYLARTDSVYRTGHEHKGGMAMFFRADLWNKSPFRSIPRSVDSWFIADNGEEFDPVCGHERDVVAVRHGANTWRTFWDVDVDDYIEHKLDVSDERLEDLVDSNDIAFYRTLSASPPASKGLRR